VTLYDSLLYQFRGNQRIKLVWIIIATLEITSKRGDRGKFVKIGVGGRVEQETRKAKRKKSSTSRENSIVFIMVSYIVLIFLV
jgi:hypothetical protein